MKNVTGTAVRVAIKSKIRRRESNDGRFFVRLCSCALATPQLTRIGEVTSAIADQHVSDPQYGKLDQRSAERLYDTEDP